MDPPDAVRHPGIENALVLEEGRHARTRPVAGSGGGAQRTRGSASKLRFAEAATCVWRRATPRRLGGAPAFLPFTPGFRLRAAPAWRRQRTPRQSQDAMLCLCGVPQAPKTSGAGVAADWPHNRESKLGFGRSSVFCDRAWRCNRFRAPQARVAELGQLGPRPQKSAPPPKSEPEEPSVARNSSLGRQWSRPFSNDPQSLGKPQETSLPHLLQTTPRADRPMYPRPTPCAALLLVGASKQ